MAGLLDTLHITPEDSATKSHCEIVMVQLDKVEIHELKPKMLTKDEGGLVWR